ncbi:MAG: hypothetical protein JRH20_00075 [Deltaproteobacteria bacterium]|nr:hypothetical protein [Deltaproteobacteria bacterium]
MKLAEFPLKMLNARLLLLTALLLPATALADLGDGVARLEKRHGLLSAHRTRLEGQLEEHGKRISRLKAQPRSVTRDLQLKTALRSSQGLANRLTSLQQRLNNQRDKLLALYAQAIRAAPNATSRERWAERHSKLARRHSSEGRLIARIKTNPLDSPEDLEEKADLLKDSEEKLERRIRALGRHITRLGRRAKLKRHGRAAQDTPFVEQSTRRMGGQRRAPTRAAGTATTTPPTTVPPPSSVDDTSESRDYDSAAKFNGAPEGGRAPDPSAVGVTGESEAAPTPMARSLDAATLQALSGKLRGTTAQKLAALKLAQKKLAKLARSLSAQAAALERKARSMKKNKGMKKSKRMKKRNHNKKR